MEQKINESDEAPPAYGLSMRKINLANRVKGSAYWVVTALISFALIYGALWDFNLVNKGYVEGISYATDSN